VARHTHTGRFGNLIIGDQIITIDQNPAGALAELHDAYHENDSASLPELPPPSQSAPRRANQQNREGITITHYNQAHDLENLIRSYGARPSGRRRLYFCPFHADEHASLSVYAHHGQQYCRCFSAHSNCPLAQHRQNDAFNIYCIGEAIDAKEALRRLNNRSSF
jgi:hypothetical protein